MRKENYQNITKKSSIDERFKLNSSNTTNFRSLFHNRPPSIGNPNNNNGKTIDITNNNINNKQTNRNISNEILNMVKTKEFNTKVFINGSQEYYNISYSFVLSEKIGKINFTQNCFDSFQKDQKNIQYNFMCFNLYEMNNKYLVIRKIGEDEKFIEILNKHLRNEIYLCFFYFKELAFDDLSNNMCVALHFRLKNYNHKEEERIFMNSLNDKDSNKIFFPYIFSVSRDINKLSKFKEEILREVSKLNIKMKDNYKGKITFINYLKLI